MKTEDIIILDPTKPGVMDMIRSLGRNPSAEAIRMTARRISATPRCAGPDNCDCSYHASVGGKLVSTALFRDPQIDLAVQGAIEVMEIDEEQLRLQLGASTKPAVIFILTGEGKVKPTGMIYMQGKFAPLFGRDRIPSGALAMYPENSAVLGHIADGHAKPKQQQCQTQTNASGGLHLDALEATRSLEK